MDIEVNMVGFLRDPATRTVILVLKDVTSDAMLPIWVSIVDAVAIANEIEKIAAPRPSIYDLGINLIRALNAELERVVISKLENDTFFAFLWLREGNNTVVIDARPSQAIALAIRADCPIYVSEELVQTAKLNIANTSQVPSAEIIHSWFEGLDDEDLGKYKM
jgi:uncharacterized protein